MIAATSIPSFLITSWFHLDVVSSYKQTILSRLSANWSDDGRTNGTMTAITGKHYSSTNISVIYKNLIF